MVDLLLISIFPSGVALSLPSYLLAGAAGEVAKDTQYQDIVSDDGGDFIPLVCKTFDVWTPYALSILNPIADRNTVRNGMPHKLAQCQLLQQLSVTLWWYNAKMILRQYSITIEDGFPDFVANVSI